MLINSGDYALVVGIEHYPDYRDLQGAINDAKEFAAWLTDKNTGGGLPDAHCKLVLSQADSRTPIQDDIDDRLDEIFQVIGNGRARRLYLFFGGHGLASSNIGVLMCHAKWSDRRRNAALDSQEYLKMVMESGKFDEVVFFLDCCRVRLVSISGQKPELALPKPHGDSPKCRYFVAYAAEFQNSAYEAKEAKATDTLDLNDPLVRGHFTRALMAALRGGAAIAPGGVPAMRLKQYLEINTPLIAKEAGHLQEPEITYDFSAVNQPVFGSAPPIDVTAPNDMVDVEITFTSSRQGPIVLVGPDNGEIKRDMPNSGPWRLKLPPLLHMVTDVATGTEQSLRLKLTEGVVHVQF